MRGNLFAVAVDLVILTVRGGALCALLVRRTAPPYPGSWALPGGFVRPREDLRDTATRQLAEQTGAATENAVTGHLEQLASYAAPDRDPRGRVLSVAHLALVPDLPEPTAGPHTTVSTWRPVDQTAGLAFDHDLILADGVERARAKLEYSTLAASFCPPEFTITDLRRVYEAVWQTEIDPRNFSRKVTSTNGFLVPTDSKSTSGRGRPAQLFRRGSASTLHPPLLRTSTGPVSA
ncbi:NUDIX domain-containing protein [Pseudonocardia hispaniensis]|uniref:NUDIX domain-containing protein n=1 Tax=Pseudonocardia hispaniensis TaxID=904933 RepID=A0ABW1J213_9PSEU